MTPNQTENDRCAIGELACAVLAGRGPYDAWPVATRLMELGHRPHVAVRVACTPPLAVRCADVCPEADGRPGREIAESIERNTPNVVHALLSRAARP